MLRCFKRWLSTITFFFLTATVIFCRQNVRVLLQVVFFFYASSYRPTLASVSNLSRTSHRCLVCNNLLCFQDMKARENIYSRKKMSSYEHGDPRLAVNCSSTSDTLPGLAKLWLRRMWAYYLQAEHSLQASTNFSQDFRSPSVHTLRFPFI